MAAKKKPAHGSKTKFVMDLPRDMPARDVVAKAKQAGLVISTAYVYVIRSSKAGTGSTGKPAKAGGAKAKPAAKGGRTSREVPAQTPQQGRTSKLRESHLVDLIVNLGLLRSSEILHSLRARFREP